MTAIQTPQIGTEIPLLALQDADVPERPAYVPPDLDGRDVRALVADAHPALQQARQVHHDRGEVVHAYRCLICGAWAILHQREHGSTLRELGGPLWDCIVAVACGARLATTGTCGNEAERAADPQGEACAARQGPR